MTAQGKLLTGLGIAALLSPMMALALFRANPELDPVWMQFDLHFYAVSAVSLAAAAACIVVMVSAATLQNTRLIFLGLAFLTIAGIFSVHGLMTPGFIEHDFYHSVPVSGWLSAFGGCAFVALSVATLPHPIEHFIERNGRAFLIGTTLAIVAYIELSVTMDAWLDWIPLDTNLRLGLGLAGLALGGFAAWRYWQAYQFARLPSQIAMIVAIVLLLEVQAIIIWGTTWHISWWIYHGLYGVAFVALFTGWTIEARRAGTLRAIADALSMRDALAQLNRGLDSRIVELVDAVEAKDEETFGHVRRVSGYALAVGKRLGLSPSALRMLAMSAEMHDVGKISIPSSVLAKPGPLTPDEYDVVKTHTHRGYEIAQQVNALHELANVIRSHHERYDGQGYPDGLAGEEIPLFSRIIAVVDSYDAITSKRPYRSGRSHADAIAEIKAKSGAQFDPRCVDAFLAVFEDPSSRKADKARAA
jgi:HD-GYP domain-containing protein (c-di-GMP phosphodiesterase class II)